MQLYFTESSARVGLVYHPSLFICYVTRDYSSSRAAQLLRSLPRLPPSQPRLPSPARNTRTTPGPPTTSPFTPYPPDSPVTPSPRLNNSERSTHSSPLSILPPEDSVRRPHATSPTSQRTARSTSQWRPLLGASLPTTASSSTCAIPPSNNPDITSPTRGTRAAIGVDSRPRDRTQLPWQPNCPSPLQSKKCQSKTVIVTTNL